MDDFREWLSDNLRYFMLGGAILIIVVVLFFSIRACSGSNKGNSGDGQKTTSTDQGNVPSSPTSEGESDEKKEDANPMETADADITALIKSYYQALGEKDIATLKTLEDDFTPSDESKVTNLKDYIEGYEVGDVYTKKGMTDNSYVVYACFSYICQGIETKAPALTQFYVYKNSEGNWVIDNGALQDSEISAYMENQLSDSDVSVPMDEVRRLGALEGSEINKAKEVLAFELTKIVHGEEEATKAQEAARALFGKGSAAGSAPTTELPAADFAEGMDILTLLTTIGVVPSRSEGRRAVQQGGVKLAEKPVTDVDFKVTADLFTDGKLLVQKGKKTFHNVVLK